MNRNWKVACTAVALAVSASLQAAVLPEHQTNSAWFTDAQTKLTTKLQTNNQFKAKNVILFVGDGMGISTLTSARIHSSSAELPTYSDEYLPVRPPSDLPTPKPHTN